MYLSVLRVLLLLVGELCFRAALAAPADTLRLSTFPEHTSLTSNAVWLETDPNAAFDEVKASSGWQPAGPALRPRADRAYWLFLVLHNDTDATEQLFLYTSFNQEVTAFPGVNRVLKAGTLVPTPTWTTNEEEAFLAFSLAAGQTLPLYIRVANVPGWLPSLTRAERPRPNLYLTLERQNYHYYKTHLTRRQNLPELTYRTWVQGALAFTLIFVGLLYARYRQRLYLYYLLYVLGALLYALLKSRSYTPPGQWLSYFPLLRTHLTEVALWGGMAAYFFFISHLLELPRRHPAAHCWFQRFGWFFVAYGFVYGLIMLLTNDGGFHYFSYRAIRFLGAGLSLGTIVWILWKVKSPLSRYVVSGYGAMAAVGLLAWLRGSELILKGVTLPGSVDNLFTITFGVLLEILVFALALAHRIRLIDAERQANHLAYIDILEKKSSYERQLAETEMQALRSQLNPHFLFNSLNSLEYFILAQENQKASHYLTRFSKLLRMVLTHSRVKAISLHDELEVLRLYLDIEKNRFGDGFQYCLEVDPEIDQDSLQIPPLLLQPYVENAIWHGLLPSPLPEKTLRLRVAPHNDNTLYIEIEDNGIGRQKSAELKKNSIRTHQSLGMEIIRQRIELFNQSYSAKMDIEVEDADPLTQTGTLVRIRYYLNYGEEVEVP
jgi:two-component sensor histidine kinase